MLIIKNNRISGTSDSLALKSFLSEGPPQQYRIYSLLHISQTLTLIFLYHIILLSHVYLLHYLSHIYIHYIYHLYILYSHALYSEVNLFAIICI